MNLINTAIFAACLVIFGLTFAHGLAVALGRSRPSWPLDPRPAEDVASATTGGRVGIIVHFALAIWPVAVLILLSLGAVDSFTERVIYGLAAASCVAGAFLIVRRRPSG